ncbi:MAG TPA: hypothetical protein VNJ01_00580 [Bacteriovoracaceae bacterium]|nr:hypothetical protein [Bacteriovoracaceae bacterium]
MMDGFEKRCEGLAIAFCQGPDKIKFYSYLEDQTYKSMEAQLKLDGHAGYLRLEKSGEYASQYMNRIEKELFSRAGVTVKMVDQQMRALPMKLSEVWSGPAAEKKLIQDSVAGASILSLGQVLSKLWNSDQELKFKKYYTNVYVGKCNKQDGAYGFEYNAFKIDNHNMFTKQKIFSELAGEVLVYCPGVILGSLQNSKGPEQFIDGLAFVLGHELTHIVDISKQPALYEKWSRCIKKSFTFPEHEKALSYKELSSDIGGINLLMARLKNLPPEEAYRALRRVLAPWLCLNPSSTSFSRKRLEIIGRDPQVIEALGCRDQAVPLCSIYPTN